MKTTNYTKLNMEIPLATYNNRNNYNSNPKLSSTSM